MTSDNTFLHHAGVKHPIICGPMYPCSNPELVSAVSEAGALGIIQPLSLTYVYGYTFHDGLRYIQSLTSKPVGMNLLIESSSRKYRVTMENWMNQALDSGVRFFITSMGKPDWVTRLAHNAGAYVYHDVTEHHWAEKALDVGVDGLIAVNSKAGGHAGGLGREELAKALANYNIPIVCAGGISTRKDYLDAIELGYNAVQMGTRFIATEECAAGNEYKNAIVLANASKIVMTERLTGVPVSVINNTMVQKEGLTPNFFEKLLLQNRQLKHLARTLLAMKSLRALKQSLHVEKSSRDYWQAGKSVDGIESILSVDSIIQEMTK